MATKRKLEPAKESKNDSTRKLSEKLTGIITSIAQELICPLSLELMVDPVTAEDGHHYERKSMETTIKAHGTNLRSPVTSEIMGPKLLPAVRAANIIENLINSGVVEKGLCESYGRNKLVFDTEKGAARNDIESVKLLASWYESGSHGFGKDVMKHKNLFEKAEGLLLKKKAEEGDAESMLRLGECYFYGTHGFSEDECLGYEWFKKSSDLKCPTGMFHAGDCLTEGLGVEKNVSYGLSLVSMAAVMGSDRACYCLGEWHFDGENGLPQDKAEAKHWLTKAVDGSCSTKDLTDIEKVEAQNFLCTLELELSRS